jgi:hypothetical protein
MTQDELVARVREVAARLGVAVLSRDRFLAESGVGKSEFERLAEDGWTAVCQAAGIAPVGRRERIPDDALFAAMRDAFLAAEGVPTLAKFERRFKYTASMFYQRGWSWGEAKARCRAWLAANDPAFPWLDRLPEDARMRRSRNALDPDAPLTLVDGAAVHEARTGRVMGERIDFRGMARAPTNEQGVVALFAMVAQDLGYAIELMGQAFPDCEATRRLRGGRYERVRIEFEYESRNFLHHKHDPKSCDVLVCWIANWQPPAHVELIELRTLIKKLPPRFGMAAGEGTTA